MTNLASQARPTPCSKGDADPGLQVLQAREARLGEGMIIRRLLPQKARRMIGAWCFLDHFGPLELAPEDAGLRVGPHPHIGLQTVTWLVAGEVLHRDSLGVAQIIRPGAVNLMTAGRGISHSEESPAGHGDLLHGIQLWIALPDQDRATAPGFEHQPDLPVLEQPGLKITLFVGTGFGEQAPTRAFSPLIGAELGLAGPGRHMVALEPEYEHGLVLVEGEAAVDGRTLRIGELAYLGVGRPSVGIGTAAKATLMLVGGAPFDESIVLWWNFVARSHAEIEKAREAWLAGGAFGEVRGYPGEPLEAPELAARPRA